IASWQNSYVNLLNQRQGRVNNLSVVEPATPNPIPVSPNTILNVAAAALVGMALSIGAVLVLEYLDDTLKTADAAERARGVTALGSVARLPHRPRRPEERLVTAFARTSPVAEAYRVVRTNLQFATLRHTARTILVTSAMGGEGKTTTACNLAVTM